MLVQLLFQISLGSVFTAQAYLLLVLVSFRKYHIKKTIFRTLPNRRESVILSYDSNHLEHVYISNCDCLNRYISVRVSQLDTPPCLLAACAQTIVQETWQHVTHLFSNV